MQSVRDPAGTDPFYSLRDPSGSGLNKEARREAGERRAFKFFWL